MNRIDKKFSDLKKLKQKAFIAFITSGYPSLGATEKLVLELSRVGVDIIELGVPFSDPLADGPVIQDASFQALKKNVCLADILRLVKKVRQRTQVPICLMTYYNPIFCFGEERFALAAQAAGVDGVIIPDLPLEEGRSFLSRTRRHGLHTILFVSPTTSARRAKKLVSAAGGFIYYVSLTGVTGTRKNLPPGLLHDLRRIKAVSKKPICVGFGVSTSAQAGQILRVADGVIVGSAIVRKIKEYRHDPHMAGKVAAFVSRMKHV